MVLVKIHWYSPRTGKTGSGTTAFPLKDALEWAKYMNVEGKRLELYHYCVQEP